LIRQPDATRSSASDWPPARIAPESYPGDCPEGHYLLCGDQIFPLAETGAGSGYSLRAASGEQVDLDAFLAEAGASPIAERFPVLAYGANRNPGTLAIKFRHHGSQESPGGDCIPVLRATMRGADVAACRLHGHGYFYGELLVASPFTAGTEIEVRVVLADLGQLRALNESEGLRQGMYSAAIVSGVLVSGLGRPVSTLAYAANTRVWSSPVTGTPVGYSVIPATGRRYPAMTSRQLMDHVLDTCGLRPAASRITGLANDDALAHEISKYLNGQWWYQFNSHDAPIPGYADLLTLVNSAMDASTVDDHSRDRLAAAGMVLETSEAFAPSGSLRLGAMLSR
jgi:hypothetical protein